MTERIPSTRATRPRTSLSYDDIKPFVFVILAATYLVVFMMSGSNSSHSTSFSITTGGKLLTNDKAFASGKDCFCSGEFYLCNATIPELSPIKNQSSNSTNPSQGTKPFWEVGGKGEQSLEVLIGSCYSLRCHGVAKSDSTVLRKHQEDGQVQQAGSRARFHNRPASTLLHTH
ncbi:hypothetical protein CB0940_03668 [Cercospora beticola]|uniref:Uncharacterized protein n=1 Tax=Cercospora beticola TaxID=122368 RepID=A0A2G5I5U3_CERBT|nr:hypothetical protein CB0940_03668 [Cercospora beticola]PIA99842.1 hypothetical protein CB0940_03668 [Cercospora beticola]WPB00848.1 hypothetical protein RHO25_005468 [Cercospora beticola]